MDSACRCRNYRMRCKICGEETETSWDFRIFVMQKNITRSLAVLYSFLWKLAIQKWRENGEYVGQKWAGNSIVSFKECQEDALFNCRRGHESLVRNRAHTIFPAYPPRPVCRWQETTVDTSVILICTWNLISKWVKYLALSSVSDSLSPAVNGKDTFDSRGKNQSQTLSALVVCPPLCLGQLKSQSCL